MQTDPDSLPEQVALRAQVRQQLMEASIDRLPEAFRTVFIAARGGRAERGRGGSGAESARSHCAHPLLFRARSLLREGLARDIDVSRWAMPFIRR